MSREGFTSIIKNADETVEFSVDTSGPLFRPLAFNGVGPFSLFGANASNFFQEGDNITIESFFLKYPYQFTNPDSAITVGLQLHNRADTWTESITEIADSGRVWVQAPNCSVTLDTYVPYKAIAGGDYEVRLFFIAGDVSMLNCPIFLNEQDLSVHFYLKVHSTRAMIV